MTIQHFKTDPSKVVLWASGTSAEIFIYPPTGDFQTRDFLFRISTATVEADETVFTAFAGITRTLMVLKGNLTLIHQDHYTKSMAPFEQDTFQGGWDTRSEGIVTDFNLMCKEGASGILNHLHGSEGSELSCDLNADFELIYLQSGKADYEGKSLAPGDVLVIKKGSGQVTLSCEEDCDFVQSSINLNS
jgi:environmental stress-induced protein Ves